MMKARGWRERYGWRESKREAMYVGGGLSVMGGGGVNEASVQA